MQFKNYARKTVSYEKQMQIAENKAKVEMTLDPLRSYLQCANIFNVETDSLYKQIASVVDLSNRNNYFIDLRQGPQTEAQKKVMYNIEHISDYAQEGVKMNFIVDMEKKKYLSAAKDEEIGTCLCCLYPVNAAKPIMLLAEEDQRIGMYTYVGTPSQQGSAYIFAKEKAGSFFIQLQEFYFFSLKKDQVHNYDHGLLLSYNPEWGWKNISFGIILKENQDMVRQLFDSGRNPMKRVELPDSSRMNAETVNHSYPWQ